MWERNLVGSSFYFRGMAFSVQFVPSRRKKSPKKCISSVKKSVIGISRVLGVIKSVIMQSCSFLGKISSFLIFGPKMSLLSVLS